MIATDLVRRCVVVEVSSSTDRVLVDCCVHHKNGTFFFIRWTDKYVLSNPENDVEYGNNLLPFGDDDVFDVVYRIPGSTGYRHVPAVCSIFIATEDRPVEVAQD